MNTDQPIPTPQETPLPRPLESLWLIARLFFRVSLGRRRSLWLGLLLVPVGMAAYWRLFEAGSGQGFFNEMLVNSFLQFLALGLPLYLGVSAIRDEIEDRTIVYLFARPVHRAVVLGGKIASVALLLSLALAVDLALVYAVAVSADGFAALGSNLPALVTGAAVVAIAVLVYSALFALFGVLLRRPMILAILVGLGWELAVSNLPGAFPRVTFMFYLKSLLSIGPEASGFMAILIPAVAPASIPAALGVLLLCTAAMLTAALLIGSVKEYKV